MNNHDVADSTDWLPTPLPDLFTLESALRCQVCKDFYETPMITSCSHTFCSLCIRRALSNENRCPLCRAEEQEIRLRSNWSMEEAVEAFKKARSAVLELARRKEEQKSRSPKRKAADADSIDDAAAPESKKLRSSARLSQSKPQPSYAPEQFEDDEDEVIHIPDHVDDPPEQPDDGLVGCPSCNKRMKEHLVYHHLDSCLGAPSEPEQPSRSAITQFDASLRRQNQSLERLPSLSYSMLKEQALRKKMNELGISSQGPRALLEKRHKEWVTIWNANCDSARPKKRSDLLAELDKWERSQGGRVPTSRSALANATMVKDKNFDGPAWAAKHGTSFKGLIANARKSSMQAKKPDAPPADPQGQGSETNGESHASLGLLPEGMDMIRNEEEETVEKDAPDPSTGLAREAQQIHSEPEARVSDAAVEGGNPERHTLT